MIQPPYDSDRRRRGRGEPNRQPGPENFQPGLVVKPQDGWTSVYSSAPIVSHQMLRGIANAAGCHVYSDAGDIVYANNDFLVVDAPQGGTRTIHLPARALRVVDIVDEATLAEDVEQFDMSLDPNTAVILKLEH